MIPCLLPPYGNGGQIETFKNVRSEICFKQKKHLVSCIKGMNDSTGIMKIQSKGSACRFVYLYVYQEFTKMCNFYSMKGVLFFEVLFDQPSPYDF